MGKTLEDYLQSRFQQVDTSIDQSETGGASHSTLTVLSEVEAIDLILRIVGLLEILHDKHLVHSNLCPKEIFLKNNNLDSMTFTNLYHAVWDT